MLTTATLLAAEGGHIVNQALHDNAHWIGIGMFILFMLMLLATLGISNVGRRLPEHNTGEIVDHTKSSFGKGHGAH